VNLKVLTIILEMAVESALGTRAMGLTSHSLMKLSHEFLNLRRSQSLKNLSQKISKNPHLSLRLTNPNQSRSQNKIHVKHFQKLCRAK